MVTATEAMEVDRTAVAVVALAEAVGTACPISVLD